MTENKDLIVGSGEGGKFTDVTGLLLPLFSDPDGRGTRRWREMFGLQCPESPPRSGLTFTVRVRPRSSSDR